METRWIYITCGTLEEAELICEALVSERIAACGNIIEGMTSMYWWEGKIAKDKETILILKTTRESEGRLFNRVKELHSYALPCMVSLPILEGHPPYLTWIKESVRENVE